LFGSGGIKKTRLDIFVFLTENLRILLPSGVPMAEATAPNEFEKLFKILGFDPSKEVGPKETIVGGGVFAEAMKEVVKERTEANKAKAVVLIKQAIDLKANWDEQEKKFLAAKKKFFQDFGKTVNKIESLSRGETLAHVEAKEVEKLAE
jgi:hypothetical protein